MNKLQRNRKYQTNNYWVLLILLIISLAQSFKQVDFNLQKKRII